MAKSKMQPDACSAVQSLQDKLRAMHLQAESLEFFSLDRLPQNVRASAWQHLRTCPHCLRALHRIEPVNYIHSTKNGFVHFRVTQLRGGRWLARCWGSMVDTAMEFDSLTAAEVHLREYFARICPEHVCEPDCGPLDANR